MTRAFRPVRRALSILLALASLSLAAPTIAAPELGPKVTTFELENGLIGVVIEDHRAPVATHMVWYRVGAADEPPGRSGIAHFLEHLMFKGTDEVAPGDFSKIVAANGGQDNAFTSYDYTAYYQQIAKDRLELVMTLESDRMRDLILDEKNVATERDVILEERSSRIDNDPKSQFYEQTTAALYLNHPYGIPVIGWRHEMETLSLDDAVTFYRRYYAPDNATLVVAGDVDPAEVERLARKHYGPLKPSHDPAAPRPVEPPQRAERTLALSDPKVRQPSVSRSFLAPSYVTAEPGEAEALAVMAEILGGGFTSRLSKALVLDQKVAISAGAYYQGVARDYGSVGWYAAAAEGVPLERSVEAIEAEIARLAADGPTAEELERAKMVLISSRVYRQDSQSSMARTYGAALTVGLTVEDVAAWPERIRAVDAEAVMAAAASLKVEQSVTGYLTGVETPGERKAEAAAGEEETAQ